jgi:5-methylcytosine-specific restriction endonuclease McrA|tara:strand:- start:650 stop:1225 length:576 start_codon:yes stop_codon:yes gene_type:complete
MRFEIIIFIIAAFIIANIHTDGKYTNMLLTWKKYYQMIGVAFAALMICILLRKNPLRAQEIVKASNEYIKYLPVDKNTSNMISPILDFTSKNHFVGQTYNQPIIPMQNNSYAQNRILKSGTKTNKRSVSETKKKFVASRQSWNCGDCNNQLSAWFEVDHKIRLENGGSNHVDNLVALCRECHGKKTAMENL